MQRFRYLITLALQANGGNCEARVQHRGVVTTTTRMQYRQAAPARKAPVVLDGSASTDRRFAHGVRLGN